MSKNEIERLQNVILKEGLRTANLQTELEEARYRLDFARSAFQDEEQKPVAVAIAIPMIWCPPGDFMMGSDDGGYDEQPVHRVTLSKGFWLGCTQVTQAQWRDVMGNNPSEFKDDDNPVENVSWYGCMLFLQKLNKLCSGQDPKTNLPDFLSLQ
jgi:formylglycine-generating enzyme required for sulfatase activity